MAKPRTLSFSNFRIFVEDPDNLGVFIAPCGFTQKALTIQTESSDANVPDCDDPEAPAWKEKAITALSAQATGAGVMAVDSVKFWRKWIMSATSRPVRVEFAESGANGGGYYQGKAVLTNLGFSTQLGSDGNKTQQQVTVDSDGEWTWVDAA